jgi:hypothetical protein
MFSSIKKMALIVEEASYWINKKWSAPKQSTCTSPYKALDWEEIKIIHNNTIPRDSRGRFVRRNTK